MFFIIVLLFIVFIVLNIHVVPQAHCFVIERLGVYHKTWDAGIHVLVPIIDHISRKISLKEQVLDFPPPVRNHKG